MPALRPDVDPEGLLEYSVVYTDRAVNHMSAQFQQAMNDISATLKSVYGATAVAVVPGSGTFGMEAVARQFAGGKNCLVIRNGWFSYRWTQIFEAGAIPASHAVLKAAKTGPRPDDPFAPPALEDVLDHIEAQQPDVVFAPHVETSAGIMLPDGYLRAIGAQVESYGGLFVLDCIASGAMWVDMASTGVDVLISAPQKGWTGSPCAGLVMLGPRAMEAMKGVTSSSFACDLGTWLGIMQAYEAGGHAYHATMPTDGLIAFRDVMQETVGHGLDVVRDGQQMLGDSVRNLLAEKGFASVAAPGYESPGVVVCYTSDPDLATGKKFAEQGLQIAAGVPLACDEPADFRTFRLGLFGLDKVLNRDRTVANLRAAIDAMAVPD